MLYIPLFLHRKTKKLYITRVAVTNRKAPINDINWENLIGDSYDTVIFNA